MIVNLEVSTARASTQFGTHHQKKTIGRTLGPTIFWLIVFSTNCPWRKPTPTNWIEPIPNGFARQIHGRHE